MIENITRRKLIGGLGLLIAAPVIVRASSLMPVRAFDDEIWMKFEFEEQRSIERYPLQVAGDLRIVGLDVSNDDRNWIKVPLVNGIVHAGDLVPSLYHRLHFG